MKLTHLGGAECVTGSCHLIQAAGVTILVDCGSVQGSDTALPMSEWPVKPCDIDYLFLTHAHIDHIGRVPELIDRGFAGEIICTHATRELVFPMIEDAMGFSDRDRHGKEKIKDRIDDFAWGFEYGRSFDLKNRIRFSLGNAGHILGSCFIRFAFRDPDCSVVFSGDLGPPDTPILPDPDIPEPCDLLVLESTYGDRFHDDRTARVERLEKVLVKALADNGKVYIPAFALGRSQELIYEMDRIFSRPGFKARFKEEIPVFMDSPLALNVTKIYSRLSEFWDKEAKELQKSGDHPIDFKNLYAVEDYKAHAKILSLPGPAIIVAGSGMCTGGRIVDHLFHGLGKRENDILFVGYQAGGTPGRDILTYAGKQGGYVWLDHEKVMIHAGVHQLSGYSAHADGEHLAGWVEAMAKPPKEIRFVHGEEKARKALEARLKK